MPRKSVYFTLLALIALSLTAKLHGLVISEIHYRPSAGDPLEFVEVSNDAPSPEDISGYAFVEGIAFRFPAGTVLEAGGVLVVCANVDAVKAVYGIENAIGNFTGRLDNGGERLTVVDHAGGVIQSVRYNDQGKWPVAPDGMGHTLVLKRVHLDASEPENWTSSPELGGSPGQRNFPEPPEPEYEETVVIDTGEEWRYRKGTAPFSDPPLDWTTEDFDDSDWLSGPSSFGNGYPDQGTELDDMVDDRGPNYSTLALRKRFVLTEEEIDGPGQLRLGLTYDDGFCAFINGTEFASSFCPEVAWDAVITDRHAEEPEEFFHIPAALRKPGENVLAVFGVTRVDFNFRLDPRVTHRVRIDEEEMVVEFRGRFNELFRGDGSGDGWVELFNAGNTTLDLGGLAVTEDPARMDPYVIPEGTTLGPKEFLVVRESDSSLSLSGERVQLFLVDSDGKVVTAAAFDRVPSPASLLDAYSEARYPDGSDVLWVSDQPTPGAANVVTRVTDIVINEIFYNPPEFRTGEFLELYHRGADGVIDLSGFRFDNGIDYTFPAGTSLAPGEYLVLSEDPDVLRDRYGLAGVHRYEGGLANGGENVRLVDGLGNLVDEVRYFDGGRWSSWADGRGSSLELIDPAQDNDFAFAWDASDESDKAEWERLSYVMPLYKRGSNGGSEFHIFLAERGVCLIDDVSIAPPEYDGSSLLGLGAEWKYRKGTEAFSDPPLAWIAPEFDDSDWLVGASPLGFRFLGLNTRLGDMRGNYTSVAARTTFSITRELLDSPEDIFFGITFDDGFCAFLNGVELDRENCPDDLTWDAVATIERVGPEKVIAIPRDLLVVGENLLAVVGFNRSVGNNDFVIAPRVALRSGNGPNVIKNPGFEDDTASWQIQGTHVDSRRITVDSRSGDACLELVASAKGNNLCNGLETETSPPLEEIFGYDVSLWARWQRGASLLILHGTFAPGPLEWSSPLTSNLATNSLGGRLRMTVPYNLGTPGEENSVRVRRRTETGSENLGPMIADVRHLPFSPDSGEPVHVVARVADADGVAAVRVVYTDSLQAGEFEERQLFDDGAHDDGDPGDGVYGGQIPGFLGSDRIAFFIEAEDTRQLVGRFPREAPERTLVYMVEGPVTEDIQIVMDDRNREELLQRPAQSNHLLDGSLVYKNDDVYYNVGLRYRGSPFGRPVSSRSEVLSTRVRFPKDQKFHRGRKEINLSNRDTDDGIWSVLIARNSSQVTPAPAFDYHYASVRFDGVPKTGPGMWQTFGRDFFEKWYGPEAGDNGENIVCLKAIGRTQLDNVCLRNAWDEATSLYMEEVGENYRFYWNHAIHQDRDNWQPWFQLTEFLDPIRTSDKEFERRVFDVLDVEAFLRVMGSRLMMRDGDAMFINNGHNGYVIWMPERGWSVLPFDMGQVNSRDQVTSLADFVDVRDVGVARIFRSPQVLRLHYRLLLEYANGYWSNLALPFLDALERDPNAQRGAHLRSKIDGSSRNTKALLEPLANVEFLITTNNGMDFETAETTVDLHGQAGIEVATLAVRLNDSESCPLDVRWDSELVTEWTGTVDLDADINVIEVFGFDSAGDVLGVAQITVSTTGSPSQRFLRGDARNDGAVNISDPITVLLHLFRGQSLWCRDAADVNDDGLLQIDDALAILEYLFLSGPAPQAPFPKLGRDPSEDDLDCEG